jgi:hypothetical protein
MECGHGVWNDITVVSKAPGAWYAFEGPVNTEEERLAATPPKVRGTQHF